MSSSPTLYLVYLVLFSWCLFNKKLFGWFSIWPSPCVLKHFNPVSLSIPILLIYPLALLLFVSHNLISRKYRCRRRDGSRTRTYTKLKKHRFKETCRLYDKLPSFSLLQTAGDWLWVYELPSSQIPSVSSTGYIFHQDLLRSSQILVLKRDSVTLSVPAHMSLPWSALKVTEARAKFRSHSCLKILVSSAVRPVWRGRGLIPQEPPLTALGLVS